MLIALPQFDPSFHTRYTQVVLRADAPQLFRERIREGRLAQLVRAPALQAGGRRFESCTAHQIGIPVNQTGDVVQLVRTLPCHGRGRGFESRRPRHFLRSLDSLCSLGISAAESRRPRHSYEAADSRLLVEMKS